MSLWKKIFGKKNADGPQPGSDGPAVGTPVPPPKPVPGARMTPPPAGPATPKPPAAAQPKAPQPPQAPKTSIPAVAPMTAGPWKARPIFISSTFRDMHAERGYLRTHVFPRLEEELRKRRHQLEPIDLRFGVESGDAASEEERELLVLKVCLGEIRKSRPFLLVLLGDRYGWVPPADRMPQAALLPVSLRSARRCLPRVGLAL